MASPAQWKKQFDTLENLRKEILRLAEGKEDAVLKKKPSEEGWSVLEICNHLMVIEQLSIGYIRHKIEKADKVQPVSWKDKIKGYLLRWALRLPFRYRAPKTVTQIPAPKSFADLMMIWDMTRAELWKVIEKIPEDQAPKGFYKHPLTGYMTISEMLDFFIVHTQRHLHQIQKTLDKVQTL